ncbi:MAG: DUF1501 domain-containing protein, partial [Planctomycetaceae bacterium]
MSQDRQFCRRTRREFVWEAGAGFGSVALCGMLGNDLARVARANDQGATAPGTNSQGAAPLPAFRGPMAPKKPHFDAPAKAVIFLFMYGGPSHIETFDYKPKMYDLDGQTIPVKTFGRGGHRNQGRAVGPKWKFQQYGQCGK